MPRSAKFRPADSAIPTACPAKASPTHTSRSLLSAPSISPPGLEKVMARVARKELPETSPAPASGTESPLPDKATAAVQDGGRYSPPDSLRNRPLQQRRMSSDNWTQARR